MTDAASTPLLRTPQRPARRPWSLPTLRELPKLTDLTLASAIGGGGGTGGGGSTVFGLLLAASTLALVSLAGCSPERSLEPSAPRMPKTVASIPCVGDVASKKISCGGLQAAPGQEIIGGQGVRVVLRSSNVQYIGTDFTFDVTVQNLTTVVLGNNGVGVTGVRVFFSSAPVATSGSGAITVEDDSVGTFTSAGQPYYKYPGSLAPRDISGAQGWRFSIPGTVTTFAFTVEVAADVVDQGGVLRWTPISGLDQRFFRDVAASSPTDWMAVGNNGLTARWDGTSWVALPAIVSENINSVTAIAPGEYLAATDGGAVLHYKNNVWTELYRRVDLGSFKAIWAKDLTQIVAVGAAGITSHLSGGTWTDEYVPTANSGDLTAVTGNAAGTLVSAINGQPGSSEVWISIAGGTFVHDPRFPSVVGVASDIVNDASGNTLVAYLEFSGPPIGMIVSSTGDTLVYDGSLWPQALVAHGTNQVAFGYYDFGGTNHYLIGDADYTSFPATASIISGELGGSFDIAQMTATDAGAAQFEVTSSNGHLLRSDAGNWTDPQGAGDVQDPDFWGVGDTVWALDGIGDFYKIVNGVPTLKLGQSGIYRLWGSSSTSFFAIDATDVWSSDGSSAWNHEATITGGSDNRDVWADPTGDAVIVLGENGWVLSRILGTWGPAVFVPNNVNAVWGCDAHTAWIVTQEGDIYSWIDGVMTVETSLGGAPPPPLRAITGSSCTDVWASGDNGEVVHWDGVSWTDLGTLWGGTTIRALTMRGPGEIYAAGDNGGGFLLSTIAGTLDLNLPTQGRNVSALWRLDNGEVYAAGGFPQPLFIRGQR